MSKHVFAPPIELLLATGLPELLGIIRGAVPDDIHALVDEAWLADQGEAWARRLLAKALTPPVHIDASATEGAPLAIIEDAPEPGGW